MMSYTIEDTTASCTPHSVTIRYTASCGDDCADGVVEFDMLVERERGGYLLTINGATFSGPSEEALGAAADDLRDAAYDAWERAAYRQEWSC